MFKGEEEKNPSNLKVSDQEGGSENPLSYSKMIADVESDEQKDLIRVSQPAALEAHNHCFLYEKQVPFVVNSQHIHPNLYFKVPLEQKLKRSQPNIETLNPILVGTPPVSTLNTLGFAGMMKYQSQQKGFLGNKESKNGPKQLGGKLISSVMVKDQNHAEDGFVDEVTQVLDEEEPLDQISHFEAVQISLDDGPEPEKQMVLDQEGVQYVIKTTSQIAENKFQFQQQRKKQDSPIQLKEDSNSGPYPKNQYPPPRPRVANSHKQQNKLSMIKQQSSNPSFGIKSDDSHKDVMIVSKIIKRNTIEFLDNKNNELQPSRMMQTDAPKFQELTHSVSPKDKNNSQPNRASKSFKKATQNDDFEDPLPSERNKPSESNEEPSSKAILEKLNNIELLLQERSERTSQEFSAKNKKRTHSPKFNLQQKIDNKANRKKIEAMHRIVPQQFLNLSSIQEKAEDFGKLFKKQKKQKPSRQIEQEITNLKNKVKELEIIQRNKQSRRERNVFRESSNDRSPKDTMGIAVNFREYNKNYLERRVSESPKYQERSNSSIEDQQFFELEQKVPSLDRCPRPDDSQNVIASFGIKVYEAFNLKVKRYGQMDVFLSKEQIQYKLNQGPTLIWDYNGKFYIGDTRNKYGILEREGKGIEVCTGQYIYEGQFRKNVKKGYGIFVNLSSGQKYKGFWNKGLYEGQGKLITKKSKYQGYFVKGVQEGSGYQQLSNGDIYQGEYVSGKFEGKGKYIWKSNNNVYVGEFKNGYIEGEGIWKGAKGDSYEGQFQKSLKHGYGVYRWRDGKIFQGKFEHGNRVNHRSPNRRIISPQRQITYDLNETSQIMSPRGETRRRKFTIRNLQEPISQKRNSQQFYRI